MTPEERKARVRAALIPAAMIDGVLLLAGVAAFFATGNVALLIGAAVAGAAYMGFALYRAGAFDKQAR
jgi:hypothetical protein